MRRKQTIVAATVAALAALTAASGSAQAAAVTDTQVFRLPESGLLGNPCGEPIIYSGEVQFVFHTTETPSGTIEGKGHINWANFTGIGEETGARYRIVQAINDELKFDVDSDSATTQSNSFTFQIISLGAEQQTAWLRNTLHLTVTPDGEVTSFVFRTEARCR